MKRRDGYKGHLVSVLLICLLLLVTACSSDGTSTSAAGGENGEGQHVIRFAHIVSEDTPLHMSALQFKENVEERSDGRIKVELFPNGQLFSSERETVEAIQIGNIEMSEVATAVMAGFKQEFSIFNLPFLYDSREHAYATFDGELGNTLTEKLPEISLVGLGFGENGFRHFVNNVKPIEKPEDLSGMKIRVIENKMYEDLFNSLGANASPLGFGEVYTSLQQGVFDGMDSEVSVIDTAKLDEVLDYLTLSNHSFTPTISLMNKQFYESLPEDLQTIVTEEGEKMVANERKLTMESEQSMLDELKKSMEVNELTEEQVELFREKLQPIFDKYAEIVGEDLVELANKAR